jgi:GntR family transcriptional repressor for pyruvate dehydrogenase complex
VVPPDPVGASARRIQRQDKTVGAPLTEAAIRKLRDMITSGRYPSGAKLPPEPELAAELGLSRNTTREAVRALSSARVLDVRRGDGTYVTSLRPEVLLEGIAFAVDLMQEDSALELIEVRRILEPAATALAAANIDDAALASLEKSLARMQESTSQADLIREDTQFHAQVATASGNDTLASMLLGISSRTIRARIWRGLIDSDATARTISEHARILEALQARDRELAWATALAHVCTTEAFMRQILADRTEPTSRARGGRRRSS